MFSLCVIFRGKAYSLLFPELVDLVVCALGYIKTNWMAGSKPSTWGFKVSLVYTEFQDSPSYLVRP